MNTKFYNIIKIIALLFVLSFLIKISLNAKLSTQLIIAPFLICSLASLGNNICNLFNKGNYQIIFQKIYALSFFSYWFGFLIYFDFFAIKNHAYSLIIFSLLFWIAGIYFFRKIFIPIKEQNSSFFLDKCYILLYSVIERSKYEINYK